MSSPFAETLSTCDGTQRLLFLCGSEEEIAQGVQVAWEVLTEAGTAVAELDFRQLDPADLQLFEAYRNARVSIGNPRLDTSFLCNLFGREVLEEGGETYRWCPPDWWPVQPTAVFCYGLDPEKHEVIIRQFVKKVVLNGFDRLDRENLPEDKLPNGSWLLIATPEWQGIIRSMCEMTDYASQEIVKLLPPFEK